MNRKFHWQYAAFPPTIAPKETHETPCESIELSHVYGYSSKGCKNNLRYNKDGNIVYYASHLGIIFDVENSYQIFHYGHKTSIKAFAIDPKGEFVATANLAINGEKSEIHIWNATDGELISKIISVDTANASGHLIYSTITSLAFSSDSKRLIAISEDQVNSISCFTSEDDWQTFERQFSIKGPTKKVLFSIFINETDFIIGGDNFISQCNENGTFKSYTLNRNDIYTGAVVLAYSGDLPEGFEQEDEEETSIQTIITAESGKLYVYLNGKFYKILNEDVGRISCLSVTNDTLVTSGLDGIVAVWDSNFVLKNTINLNDSLFGALSNMKIISVVYNNDLDQLLLGNEEGDIFSVKVKGKNYPESCKYLNQTHHLDVFCCEFHPTDPNILASVGADLHIYISNVEDKEVRIIDIPNPSSSVAFNHAGDKLAITIGHVGTFGVNGIALYSYPELSCIFSNFEFSTVPLSNLKYSSDDSSLFVASSDGKFYVFPVSNGLDAPVSFGISGAGVVNFDVSKDGTMVQAELDNGKYIYYRKDFDTFNTLNLPSIARDIEWDTWTCTTGYPVQGLWKRGEKKNYSTVARSHNEKLLVTCTDSGTLEIFNYPCLSLKNEPSVITGHQTVPLHVSFNCNDKLIATAGGLDSTIMIWKPTFVKGEEEEVAAEEGVETTENEEGEELETEEEY